MLNISTFIEFLLQCSRFLAEISKISFLRPFSNLICSFNLIYVLAPVNSRPTLATRRRCVANSVLLSRASRRPIVEGNFISNDNVCPYFNEI